MVREYKKCRLAAMILMLICMLLSVIIYVQRTDCQKEIADAVLRLHVRANSDNPDDQALKLKVRDQVLKTLSVYREDMMDIDSSKQAICKHKDEIKKDIVNLMAHEDVADDVDINIDKEWFPEKKYGDIVLPQGWYEAVVVNIGSGQGKNWWCVLFPQLCFIDPVYGYMPESSKEVLEDNLSDESYRWIVDEKVEAKLKIVEWIQEKMD